MDVILILILVIAIIQTVVSKLSKRMASETLKNLSIAMIVTNAILLISFLFTYEQAEQIGGQTNFLMGAVLGYSACVFVNHFIEDIVLQDDTKKEEA